MYLASTPAEEMASNDQEAGRFLNLIMDIWSDFVAKVASDLKAKENGTGLPAGLCFVNECARGGFR